MLTFAELRNAALIMAAAVPLAARAMAATESVLVTKAMDDKAIVTRSNGESYLIEKGTGCLSLWRYEGKEVLIISPGLFLGVGSKLLIPDLDQECRIWSSEQLSGSVEMPPSRRNLPAAPTPSRSAAPDSGAILTIQKALRLVGHDPGTTDGTLGPQTAAALEDFGKSKGYQLTQEGIRKTLAALALDVFARNPNNQDALELSLDLIMMLQSPASLPSQPSIPQQTPSGSGCEDGHWIESVSSGGEIVKLEDGSIWEINVLDRIDTTLWLPTENVVVCGDRLINTDSGDSVDAARIK